MTNQFEERFEPEKDPFEKRFTPEVQPTRKLPKQITTTTPWPARHPYLAAIPPTAFGVAKESIPYVKYLDPEERERFWKSSPEEERLELLKEARDAVLFAGIPRLIKGVTPIVSALSERLLPRLAKVAKTHLWGRQPPTPTPTPTPTVPEVPIVEPKPTITPPIKKPSEVSIPVRRIPPTPLTEGEVSIPIQYPDKGQHIDITKLREKIPRKIPVEMPPQRPSKYTSDIITTHHYPPHPPVRDLWEMTQEEASKLFVTLPEHKHIVFSALKAGEKVPKNVLKDYPEFKSLQPITKAVKAPTLRPPITTPDTTLHPPITGEITKEKGVSTIEKVLTSPFRLLTGITRSGPFRALETIANKLLQPEQYLSREPAGQSLYDMTIKSRRFWRDQLVKKKALVTNITKSLSPEEREVLPTLIDYANEQVQPMANQIYKASGEISDIMDKTLQQRVLDVIDSFRGKASDNVIKAAKEHVTKVARPIWTTAKRFDPDIGQQYGYFTHFPLESELRTLQNEVKMLTKQLLGTTGDVAEQLTKSIKNLNTQIAHLEKVRVSRIEGLNDTLAALRYKMLPNGKYFGPMNEARALHGRFGYDTDYSNVMNRYLEGAYRKIFLDRYMPRAKALVDRIEDPALRQYAYNHIMSQRGTLGTESRLFTSKALEELGLSAHQDAYTQGVNFATRLQYLTKIGLSWIRFPFVNLTQIGFTWAAVGEKAFAKGMARISTHPHEIYRIARRFNVISESEIRGALAEFESAIGKMKGAASVVEHILISPARWSEQTNRLNTLAIGLEWAKEQGIKGLHNQIKVALKLIGDTQWIYHGEALPHILQKPTGKLIFQFRSFAANAVNFMTKALRNENYGTFARSLGLLTVLAGSSMLPFKLYDSVRRGVLRNTGRDIGEFSPLTLGTERLGHMVGLENMGVELGSSFEWLNVPSRLSQLFGPTLAPIAEELPTLTRPEEIPERARRQLESFAPPVTRALQSGEVFSKAGRYIGRRRPLEKFFLQRPLESVRSEYITLMANAMSYQIGAVTSEGKARGQAQVKRLLEEAQRKGLTMDKYDLAEVKRQAREMTGVYEEKGRRKEEATRRRLEQREEE